MYGLQTKGGGKTMDDKTEKLIRDLAEKLGTTSEHLWTVMVRQAPISGVTAIFEAAIMIIAVVAAFYFVQDKTATNAWMGEGAFFAWFGWVIFTVVVFMAVCCSIEDTVSAIFNPEYWALNKLLP
jgi:hypothetical protein